jgi:hypothetical protein
VKKSKGKTGIWVAFIVVTFLGGMGFLLGVQVQPNAVESLPYTIRDTVAWTDDGVGTLRRKVPAAVISFDSTDIHIEYDYVGQTFNVYARGLERHPGREIRVVHNHGQSLVDVFDHEFKGLKVHDHKARKRGVNIIVRDSSKDELKFKAFVDAEVLLSKLEVELAGH